MYPGRTWHERSGRSAWRPSPRRPRRRRPGARPGVLKEESHSRSRPWAGGVRPPPPRSPGRLVKTVKIMHNGLWRCVAPDIPALRLWAARSVPAVTLVIGARSAEQVSALVRAGTDDAVVTFRVVGNPCVKETPWPRNISVFGCASAHPPQMSTF